MPDWEARGAQLTLKVAAITLGPEAWSRTATSMGMMRVSLAEAEGQLGSLLDQVEAGDTVTITRRGRAVAKLTAVQDVPRKPVDLDSLRVLTAGLPLQDQSAVDVIRAMRDGSRY